MEKSKNSVALIKKKFDISVTSISENKQTSVPLLEESDDTIPSGVVIWSLGFVTTTSSFVP